MGSVSRSDRNRSNADSVTEKIFWDEIDKLEKKIRALSPRSGQAPQITSHPQDRALNLGGTATFNVTAIGQSPLVYQWYHDGDALAGETAAKLVLTDVEADDEGEYWVVVTNGVGEATSNRATLSAAVVNDTFPIGGIAMWSGLLADIPTNYALCDGTNGTPDMRDRFVMGVRTSATEPGSTGGVKRHIHGISTADVAGNKAMNATAPIGGDTGSAGSTTDAHTTTAVQSGAGTNVFTGPASHTVAGHTHTLPAATGNHEHTLEGKTTTDRKTDNTAFADDYEALPPWFEVAFIQRKS